jgi:competence protein ComEA
MNNLSRLMLVTTLALITVVTPSIPAVGADGKLININTASAAELAEVNGIGGAKAKAIVEYREKSGPFKSVDDLQNVKGIGEKLLARVRSQITVGASAETAGAVAAPAPAAAKR